jgi:hypothetical protein
MVTIETQAWTSYKIKQDTNDEYDCVLCDPQIKSLLGYDLVCPKDFGARQSFFLPLFKYKKPIGRFNKSNS